MGTLLDGKYRVLQAIGHGGMGTVFEAHDTRNDCRVAIKVVGGAGSEEAFVRLEREAELVRAIRHPNILQMYDVGRLPNGRPYVVLERLVGHTLALHWQSSVRAPVADVIDVFAQLLAGLTAVHDARILHRDLKPQNVFLSETRGPRPVVKVLDFGFAANMATVASARITRPGRAVGTVQYMSPEQVRGMPLDARSDLFAVAVMLYEALTGRHPFIGSSQADLQNKIVNATPRPIRQRRPGLPERFEDLVTAAMSKSPEARPRSAADMRDALLAMSYELPVAFDFEDEEPPSVTSPIWTPSVTSPSA